MSVEFENQDLYPKSRSILGNPEVPKMVNVLLKFKIIKSEKIAYIVLFVTSLVFFVFTIFLFIYYFNLGKTPQMSREQTIESLIKGRQQ